jgi:hypothetical protein
MGKTLRIFIKHTMVILLFNYIFCHPQQWIKLDTFITVPCIP